MEEKEWQKVRKVLFLIAVLVAILAGFLCALCGCEVGCEISSRSTVPDMTAPNRAIQCRGPLDSGKMAWWNGEGEPIGFPFPLHVRYVCRNHGPDRNGWWFEAEPERRVMP